MTIRATHVVLGLIAVVGLHACSKKQEGAETALPPAAEAPAVQAQPEQAAPQPAAEAAPAAAPTAVNAVLNTPATEPALAKAQEIFRQRCVMCHGESGTGTGPASANLQPKPRNYTDPTWQASVTDAALAAIIVGGGDAVGKSMMMPANPDLKDQPDVVNGLVKIVRGFAPGK